MICNAQIQYPDYGTIATVSDTITSKTTTISSYNHILQAK